MIIDNELQLWPIMIPSPILIALETSRDSEVFEMICFMLCWLIMSLLHDSAVRELLWNQ